MTPTAYADEWISADLAQLPVGTCIRVRDDVAWLVLVVAMAFALAAEEPAARVAEHQSPPFEYTFVRIDQGSGYTAFRLTLLRNADDHVAFVLFNKGQRVGAFSLKPTTTTTNSVTYWLSCMRKDFLDEYGEGSALVVSGWPLKLSEAALETRSAEVKKSQPDGPANGSQPVRSETNRTSAAAGSDR